MQSRSSSLTHSLTHSLAHSLTHSPALKPLDIDGAGRSTARGTRGQVAGRVFVGGGSKGSSASECRTRRPESLAGCAGSEFLATTRHSKTQSSSLFQRCSKNLKAFAGASPRATPSPDPSRNAALIMLLKSGNDQDGPS